MKRSVQAKNMTRVASVLAVSIFFVAGCREVEPPPSETASIASQWQRTPAIADARWDGNRALMAGEAEPNSRVVFEDASGAVHAANANADGHFEIELTVPDAGLMLKPRSQIGQTFIDGQGQVFLLPARGGLAVTLIDGEASQRVGASGPLDSADADGAVLILSGRVDGPDPVVLAIGPDSYTVPPDTGGRWSVATTAGRGPVDIRVGSRAYRFPGVGSAESGPLWVEGGWLMTRSLGGNAVQTTWMPVDM